MAPKLLMGLLLCAATLLAEVPELYARLGSAYAEDLERLEGLAKHPFFSGDSAMFGAYAGAVEAAFAVGFEAQRALKKDRAGDRENARGYLKALRSLEPRQKALYRRYEEALSHAMREDDFALFVLLLEHPLEPLRHKRLRDSAVAYYEAKRDLHKNTAAEALYAEYRLDARSLQIAEQERNAYRDNLEVVEADAAQKRSRAKSAGNVLVSTEKRDGVLVFVAENYNAFTVTVHLDFKELENFVSSAALPAVFEVAGNGRLELLQLQHRDLRKKASFRSFFGWVMGSAGARHDDTVLYRIPFEQGSTVPVSQGYNGMSTHKGLTQHAVDFSVPVGTPIYAARGGRVVSTEARHDRHGFSEEFGKYANYIIIEHADGTLGNYYHLRRNGVLVNVGQQVSAGQKIGYSGNTGYSNGPHLHFSVSMVEPKGKKRPMTLPVHFITAAGAVEWPKQGDFYTVR